MQDRLRANLFAEGVARLTFLSEAFNAERLSRETRPDGAIMRAEVRISYGAQFAEVGVDVDTAEIRLRRMLGVFAAGRILNAKTARSQLIGGIIWGLGAALHEEAVAEPEHRSRMRSSTPPECACAIFRSPSTRCCPACRRWTREVQEENETTEPRASVRITFRFPGSRRGLALALRIHGTDGEGMPTIGVQLPSGRA
jgi:hypothetical protein